MHNNIFDINITMIDITRKTLINKMWEIKRDSKNLELNIMKNRLSKPEIMDEINNISKEKSNFYIEKNLKYFDNDDDISKKFKYYHTKINSKIDCKEPTIILDNTEIIITDEIYDKMTENTDINKHIKTIYNNKINTLIKQILINIIKNKPNENNDKYDIIKKLIVDIYENIKHFTFNDEEYKKSKKYDLQFDLNFIINVIIQRIKQNFNFINIKKLSDYTYTFNNITLHIQLNNFLKIIDLSLNNKGHVYLFINKTEKININGIEKICKLFGKVIKTCVYNSSIGVINDINELFTFYETIMRYLFWLDIINYLKIDKNIVCNLITMFKIDLCKEIMTDFKYIAINHTINSKEFYEKIKDNPDINIFYDSFNNTCDKLGCSKNINFEFIKLLNNNNLHGLLIVKFFGYYLYNNLDENFFQIMNRIDVSEKKLFFEYVDTHIDYKKIDISTLFFDFLLKSS